MITGTIVLEGGATRGVFTSGILDYLMEEDLYFSHVIGVSAGSCNGVDYVSRQIGRTKKCMIPEKKEYSYYSGVRSAIKEKSILDMDMVFDTFPKKIYPFDFETYFQSDMVCEIVTTNCETGKAEYMTEQSDPDRLMKLCRASSSMPLLSPIVNIDGVPYLDGGLADSVPIRRALQSGNEKIVLVLTRNPGYRKKPISKRTVKLYRRAYKKYPNLVHAAIYRNHVYNKTMELVERLEEEEKIFVIRPLVPTVSRLERDETALTAFYQHGYNLMKRQREALQRYLEK
ncbi:MAG: patatin family protein [Lachnospiraceae bacterium]